MHNWVLIMSKLPDISPEETPSQPNKRKKGAIGEELAVHYLQKQKFKVLEQNYRRRFGEIDIVCRDNKTLVFVEVKTGRTDLFGPPETWVGVRKQRQIAKVAASYIQYHRLWDMDCRFDVIGISIDKKGKPDIVHLRDAFRL